MLVDVKFYSAVHSGVLRAIARVHGNSPEVIRHAKGVYEIGHFSFDHLLKLDHADEYPALTCKATVVDVAGDTDRDDTADRVEAGDYFGAYGVCDTYQQVLDQCAELSDTHLGTYCVAVTKITKAHQSSEGGWRWHKWGRYIGTQVPTCEYLYDEPVIDTVYCFHVYRIPANQINTDLVAHVDSTKAVP